MTLTLHERQQRWQRTITSPTDTLQHPMKYRFTATANFHTKIGILGIKEKLKELIRDKGKVDIESMVFKSSNEVIGIFAFTVEEIVCSEDTDEQMLQNMIDLYGDLLIQEYKIRLLNIEGMILAKSEYKYKKVKI